MCDKRKLTKRFDDFEAERYRTKKTAAQAWAEKKRRVILKFRALSRMGLLKMLDEMPVSPCVYISYALLRTFGPLCSLFGTIRSLSPELLAL